MDFLEDLFEGFERKKRKHDQYGHEHHDHEYNRREQDHPECDQRKPFNSEQRFCTQCGIANLVTAKFCTDCGTKIEKPTIPQCPRCSKVLPANAKFCPECGTKA